MRNNNIILLAVFVLLAIVSFFVLQNKDSSLKASNEQFFIADLQNNINEVNSVIIKKDGKTATLSKNNGVWHIAEENGFFADANQLATLLLELRQIKLKTKKTSNPDNYASLGLSDEKASHIVLKTTNGQIADISIGKKAQRSQGIYVKHNAEKQTWLASGLVKINPEAKNWIVSTIIDIESNQVQSVEYLPKEAEPMIISKKIPADKSFALENIPDGKQQKASADLNALANGLKKFNIESATPRAEIADGLKTMTVKYKLFSGMVYQLNLYKQEENHLLTVDIEKDDGKSKISSELDNWQFVIPQFKYDAMHKSLDDFIEDIPPAEPEVPAKEEKNN